MDNSGIIDDRKLDADAIKLQMDKDTSFWSLDCMLRGLTGRPCTCLGMTDHSTKGGLRAIAGDIGYAPSIGPSQLPAAPSTLHIGQAHKQCGWHGRSWHGSDQITRGLAKEVVHGRVHYRGIWHTTYRPFNAADFHNTSAGF